MCALNLRLSILGTSTSSSKIFVEWSIHCFRVVGQILVAYASSAVVLRSQMFETTSSFFLQVFSSFSFGAGHIGAVWWPPIRRSSAQVR